MKKKEPKNISSGYRIIKKEESDSDSESSRPKYQGKKYQKEQTETTQNTDEDYSSDSDENGKKYKYTSLTDTNYKGKSKQAEMTKEQIKEKLKGYKALKTTTDKKILLELQPFKTWVRYFNTETKQFRVGGLLKLVDPDLRYIMLVNTAKGITWSVQLNDNIIFIPDPEKQKEKLKEKLKEECEKDKLYKMYKAGKLKKKE
jgi:hypothetical protein